MFLLLFYLACTTTCSAFTSTVETEALLSWKERLSRSDGLFNWRNGTDPCDDGWVGVVCDNACNFGENSCSGGLIDTSAEQHITGLSFTKLGAPGGYDSYNWTVLSGPLVDDLGNLLHLTYINLAGNALTGTLPPQLLQLPQLEYLVLADNQLEGSIPDTLGNVTNLKLLMLSNNIFKGPLPLPNSSWCREDFTAAISLQGNYGLCGWVPPCLASKIVSTAETTLLSYTDEDGKGYNQNIAVCCGAKTPQCTVQNGCGISVPTYWTNLTTVTFNYTRFTVPLDQPPEVGNAMEYYWTVSTNPREPTSVSIMSLDAKYVNDTTGNITVGQLITQKSSSNTADNVTQELINVPYYAATVTLPEPLSDGQTYYVYLFGVNSRCPNARGLVTSLSVTVVTQAPLPGDVFMHPNGGEEKCGRTCLQSSVNVLKFSFTPFTHSFNIANLTISYQYELFSRDYQQSLYGNVSISPDQTTVIIPNITLDRGSFYSVRVWGTNAAGLSSYKDTQIQIESSSKDTAVAIAVGVSLGFVGLVSLVAGGSVYFILNRNKQREKKKRQEREQMKGLRSMMTGMSAQQFKKLEEQFEDIDIDLGGQALAFVVTDLESSTAQAAANKEAYQQIQDIHDTIMRENIGRYNGYEINTEGDSFHIAFTDVGKAALFCMDTQYRLLENNWSDAVLKLPGCKQVFSSEGELCFSGPRVRMGVHWAEAGTMTFKQHPHTKHWVFGGPGFRIAYELGDAASGGQVIMTEHAWQQLRYKMHDAGFPIVSQLGLYDLGSLDNPIWIYEVQGLLGRPLHRKFPGPRGIKMPKDIPKDLATGLGYELGLPPEPDFGDTEDLSCSDFGSDYRCQDSQGQDTMPFLAFVRCCLCCPLTHDSISRDVVRQMVDVISICAAQYRGYITHKPATECSYTLAFASTLDAVRFALSTQAYLLYTKWPLENEDQLGPTERTVDGRLLFRGPRVSMAITETCEYTEEIVPTEVDENSKRWKEYLYRKEEVLYGGKGVSALLDLADVIHGGQVVLSEMAWSAVHEQLPSQCQAISLGVHVISEGAEPELLMEVLPTVLQKRAFPPLHTVSLLSPGFRESPDPEHDMAIIFVKVSKPVEVCEAESELSHYNKDKRRLFIASYKFAVTRVESVVREALEHFWMICRDGYECKEPEPGRFTVAFRSVRHAIMWCSEVQMRLLDEAWSAEVLQWKESAVNLDEEGRKIWCGLRVRMGMACGRPNQRKPLNTGHADYFGSLPNLAARVCGVAQPGQVLVDLHEQMLDELNIECATSSTVDVGAACEGQLVKLDGVCDYPAMIHNLGMFWLKGFNSHPRILASVMPGPLLQRKFKEPDRGKPANPAADLNRSGRHRVRSVNEDGEPTLAGCACGSRRLKRVMHRRKRRRGVLVGCFVFKGRTSEQVGSTSHTGSAPRIPGMDSSDQDMSLYRPMGYDGQPSLSSTVHTDRSFVCPRRSSGIFDQQDSFTHKNSFDRHSVDSRVREWRTDSFDVHRASSGTNLAVEEGTVVCRVKSEGATAAASALDEDNVTSPFMDAAHTEDSIKRWGKRGTTARDEHSTHLRVTFDTSTDRVLGADPSGSFTSQRNEPLDQAASLNTWTKSSVSERSLESNDMQWQDQGEVFTFAPESLLPTPETLAALRVRSGSDTSQRDGTPQASFLAATDSVVSPVSGNIQGGNTTRPQSMISRMGRRRRRDDKELLKLAELEADVEMEGRRMSSTSVNRSMSTRGRGASRPASRRPCMRSSSVGVRSPSDASDRPTPQQSTDLHVTAGGSAGL